MLLLLNGLKSLCRLLFFWRICIRHYIIASILQESSNDAHIQNVPDSVYPLRSYYRNIYTSNKTCNHSKVSDCIFTRNHNLDRHNPSQDNYHHSDFRRIYIFCCFSLYNY